MTSYSKSYFREGLTAIVFVSVIVGLGYGIWLNAQPRPLYLNSFGGLLRSLQPPSPLEEKPAMPFQLPQLFQSEQAEAQQQNPPEQQVDVKQEPAAIEQQQITVVVADCESSAEYRLNRFEQWYYYRDFYNVLEPCPGWETEFSDVTGAINNGDTGTR
ncbi:MAG TPA: hypothetical protein V6D10_07305 [Trichocoleus sp.]|jgi:hypothetical protein